MTVTCVRRRRMIPEIGLMIGGYIFARLLSLATRSGENVAVKIFALLGMLGAVGICMDLLFRSGTSSVPKLP